MKKFNLSTLALLCAAVLSGCGDAETNINELPPTIVEEADDHDDEHDGESSPGRLAIASADEAVVHIFDLEDNTLIDSITITNPAESLYSSPENRYAVAVQRSFDTVEFIDGGLWQELHDDHYDQHEDDPELSSFALFDVKPTHYVPREDQTLIFFDGDQDSGVNASLSTLSDESISEETTIADHDFDTYMHGTGEIRGDYVLATLRDTASTSILPDSVALLELHDDHFDQEEIFATACPELHGSFQNETHIAFACSDGILSIEQNGNVFTDQKIANPAGLATGSRIGTLKGSEESSVMIGTASSDFYLVDLEHQDITLFEWQAEDGLTSLTYGFDGHNEHLLILDSDGYLNLYPAEDDWVFEERFEVFSDLEDGAEPSIIASKSSEVVYIINGDEVFSVDLHEGEVSEILHLDFTPAGAAWLGIAAEEEHDHE